jgi:hypothetical protein
MSDSASCELLSERCVTAPILPPTALWRGTFVKAFYKKNRKRFQNGCRELFVDWWSLDSHATSILNGLITQASVVVSLSATEGLRRERAVLQGLARTSCHHQAAGSDYALCAFAELFSTIAAFCRPFADLHVITFDLGCSPTLCVPFPQGSQLTRASAFKEGLFQGGLPSGRHGPHGWPS